ncbi:uncharacterized protein A4U43_C04F21580 [Asparagus officinalis]|uniref:U1-type domain-containing protein n=1 Tax=Asparagus officinalis TaxID=4686 RepID=A0A5P1F2S4_ASPOF|nr:zinc finger protein 346-like [Asparagus officinalis]XP_020261663.1 zinc finger protein 346-like [Asparagus officinalis]XP_020261664.1 zinc finger protein 346-like [Asparagus officinalis]ONK72648.1 uncharacterized protein A4U43_C04F21580 [Asparagus officinalis]
MDPPSEKLEEELHFCEQKITSLEEIRPYISFEDAWKRELEYRDRIEKKSLHSSISSRVPSATSQELPPKNNLYERKRKATFSSTPLEEESPSPLNQHASLEQNKPSSQHLQCKRCLPQQPSFHKPALPLLKEPQTLALAMQSSSSPVNQFWCNICQVPCMNDFSYKQHCQGKKHKAKWEETFGNSKEAEMKRHKLLWCNECSILCVNELALSQHLVGKKHTIRLHEVRLLNVSSP